MDLSSLWSPLMVVGLLASLGAGVVRGFSGFGFSAVVVASVSLVMAPATVVPAVLVLEVIASLSVWRSAVRGVDMPWLKALLFGNLLCVPVGVYLLSYLDPVLLRLVVGLALLVTALGLRWFDGVVVHASPGVLSLAGGLSGFLNGLAASGGIAAALLMAACHAPPRAMRSTLIVFLVFAASYTLLWAAVYSQGHGSSVQVFSLQTLRWVLVLTPGMLLGMRLGRWVLERSRPADFRRLVLHLLILLSSAAVARALLDWIAQ